MLANARTAATGPYVALKGAFTPQEVDEIIALGEALAVQQATIGSDYSQASAVRITRIAAFPREAATEAVYRKMEMLVRHINSQVFNFDLVGFSESFQYSVYQDAEGGHYDWHVDQGISQATRKLSFSLQLSDSADYDGCDLELFTSTEITPAPRERGTLIAFPAYALHRVTPIRRGIRRSLVVWTAGPPFR